MKKKTDHQNASLTPCRQVDTIDWIKNILESQTNNLPFKINLLLALGHHNKLRRAHILDFQFEMCGWDSHRIKHHFLRYLLYR